MTTLSTHDTKRSEDVRARLLAARRGPTAGTRLWSAVRGAAPPSTASTRRPPTCCSRRWSAPGRSTSERLTGYLEKARARPSCTRRWNDPDERYEGACSTSRARCLDGDVAADASTTARRADAADDRARSTLGAKLLQLTLPGVPDVYQGGEAGTFARRPRQPARRSTTPAPRPLARARRRRRSRDDLADDKLWVTSHARCGCAATRPDAVRAAAPSYEPLASRRRTCSASCARDGVGDRRHALARPARARRVARRHRRRSRPGAGSTC